MFISKSEEKRVKALIEQKANNIIQTICKKCGKSIVWTSAFGDKCMECSK